MGPIIDYHMKRWLLCLLVVSLQAGPAAARRQDAAPVDLVAWFLADFESALGGTETSLDRLLSADLAAAARDLLSDLRSRDGHGSLRVAMRERERRGLVTGYITTVDVLAAHDQTGRVATFEVTLRRRTGNAIPFEIANVQRIAHLEGLFKLTLDTTQQFAVKGLSFAAPDLTLKIPSGVAFTARDASGITAIVLRGRGNLHFTPRDRSEQDQLRIFNRRPSLDVDVEDVYIRLNSADFDAHLSAGALSPAALDPAQAAHAQNIFDRFLPKSYSLTLGDLSSDRWSIPPPPGNVAVEFKPVRRPWLTYARSIADPEDITLFDRENGHNISLYGSLEKVERRGRFYDEDSNAAYDILRYGLDVTIDPSREQVTGRARLRLRIATDATQSLSVRLAESLVITSVVSPDVGRLYPLRVAGQTTVLIGLPETVAYGRELTLDIAYAGHVESEELGEIVAPDHRFSLGEGLELLQQPEPRYLYSHRSYWYPQGLTNDFAPATMRVTVPAEYDVVATGAEVSSSVANGSRTVEFSAERPVRYLSCQISRFVPVARTAAGTVAIDVLATPRQVSANRGVAAHVSELVAFYADRFGEPPYPRLTVTAADALLPGGHSPAYFALIQQPLNTTPYTWRQDPLAFDAYPDFLTAHEIAHQWWGQAVGYKNYHDQWLSEGLAQYSALAFVAASRPELERSLVIRMRESAADHTSSGPIYLGYRLGHIEGRSAAFRAVVYNKAALVMHMLRRLIGDEAFVRGLRRFYGAWRFRKAGTDDLRAAIEAEAGRPLGRFFDRWILGSTIPRLKTSAAIDPSGAFVTVRVEQTGDIFDVPLTVSVQYADGTAAEVTLPLADEVTTRRIPLTGRVRRIVTKDELTLADFVN